MNIPGPGDALIDALRDPAAYPHAVATPVRIVETHVSWVLLTGPYAYKIKKPLKLSFLDYSTAARRAALCEEELRLNRRFAPELYLDTVPIVRDGASLRIGAAGGVAVERAVRMVQFDTREELDALVERAAVAREDLAELGVRLGEFHARAAPADEASDYGAPTRVEKVTLDNLVELDALELPAPGPEQVAQLRGWVKREFARVTPAMETRRGSGHIRECHGDLHCANVVRWQGRLTPFDGIEFDPALRYIDVVADLAFLTMDLAARGRRDLRHALLNAWTQSQGDYDSLPLVPWYETYRALVRAKVSGLRKRQFACGSAEARAALAMAQRYLAWAVQRTAPPRPALLLTCGLSGSGKTWLARQAADEWRALHLRSDVERKRLAGLTALADSRSAPDAGLYTREFNTRTYARLVHCAEASLRGGENVIVDAAFLRLEERNAMLQLAQRLQAPIVVLHCSAPMDVLRTRIAARREAGNDASEADVTLLERQPACWEPLTGVERALTIEVDTSRAQEVQAALSQLRARLAAPV